jgi:hypothetical protein
MQNKICIFSNILKPHILLVTQAITQLMKISTVDFRTRISSIFDPRHRLLTLDLDFLPSTFDLRPRFSTSTFEPRPQLLNLDPRPVTHDPRHSTITQTRTLTFDFTQLFPKCSKFHWLLLIQGLIKACEFQYLTFELRNEVRNVDLLQVDWSTTSTKLGWEMKSQAKRRHSSLFRKLPQLWSYVLALHMKYIAQRWNLRFAGWVRANARVENVKFNTSLKIPLFLLLLK